MIKKILLGTLFVGLIAVLVFGAVNRTVARSGETNGIVADLVAQFQSSESRTAESQIVPQAGDNQTAGLQQEHQYSGQETAEAHGTGNNKSAAQSAGTGQGKGAGRAESSNGSGQGRQSNQAGAGQGNQQKESGASNGAGTGVPDPQAEVQVWLSLSGTVASVSDLEVVIQLQEGGQLVLEGRSLSYALEQGLRFQTGDQLMLAAFDENGSYEVGGIQNLSNGQVTLLREESGRPLWAGRGRRGGN